MNVRKWVVAACVIAVTGWGVLLAINIYGEEPKTADDLFHFLIKLRYADGAKFPYRMPEFERKLVDLPGFNGKTVKFPLAEMKTEPRFGDAGFAKAIADVEGEYGNLPEYWELRAQVGAYTNADYDREMLMKAYLLDPARTDDLFFAKLPVPESGKADDEPSPYVPSGFHMVDPLDSAALSQCVLSEQSKLKPDDRNAFYPMMYAACLIEGGEFQAAYDQMDAASLLNKFEPPRLFPWKYISDNLEDAANASGPFSDIGAKAIGNVFTEQQYFDLVDYMGLNSAYKTATDDALSGKDWKKKFTTLNRAACVLRNSEYDPMLSGLESSILTGICRRKAYRMAVSSGDADMELPLTALYSVQEYERGGFRGISRLQSSSYDTSPELLSIFDDVELKETSRGPMSEWIRKWQGRKSDSEDNSTADGPKLDAMLRDSDLCFEFSGLIGANGGIMSEYVAYGQVQSRYRETRKTPVSDFDFENPRAWYENWLKVKGLKD